MANIIKKSEKNKLIVQSFIDRIISNEWEEPTHPELCHICKFVDYDKIPDRVIADNEFLYDIIPWDKVDRMKVLRLVARGSNVINFVDLSKYNYTIREVRNTIKIRPNIIHSLNIDLTKLNQRDVFIALTIGLPQITNCINTHNYKFTPKEVYEIIEANNFPSKLTRSFDLSKLQDYHISDIIINTGYEFLDVLNINKLTARKWLDILHVRTDFIDLCNLEKFKESDIYNSVELICMFPDRDFNFLIKNRNYKDDVSPFGWYKLLMSRPHDFLEICSFDKLNKSYWLDILRHHPYLRETNSQLQIIAEKNL